VIRVSIDHDLRVTQALRGLVGRLADLSPVTRDLAALGESQTRLRFRTQTGPEGDAWRPSLRVRLKGGRTLTRDGHLAGSLSARSEAGYAEWGVNRVYAAIHQFGGAIRPKSGGRLVFSLASGDLVFAKKVTMPKRPYLGVSSDDADDMLDLIRSRLEASLDAR